MKRTRNYFQFLLVLLMAVGGLTGSSLVAQEDFYVNADMPRHKAVLDAQGRLLAWYHPEKT